MKMETQESRLFELTLKTAGYFATSPRLDLFKTLQKNGSQSVEELIKQVSKQDQATLYRNLKLFSQLGIVRRLQMGRFSKYELTDIFQHHHHHLNCNNCGKTIILRVNPVLEEVISHLSVKNGFRPTDHQLEITGYCRDCQTKIRL